MMSGWILFLVIAMMAAALGFVVAGVVVMARGGETNQKWGNFLMRGRVWAQGLVVALLFILFILSDENS